MFEKNKIKDEKTSAMQQLFELFETVIISLVVVIVIFSFAFRMVGVDGKSMNNTLQHGDRVIVENLFYTPHRGDIVVMNKDDAGFEKPIIKRIIAIEGDVIDFSFDKGEVYLNGELLDEPYIAEAMESDRGFSKFPQTVPENHIFVMGDNRNHSEDSRRARVGMVEEKRIIGRAVLKIFPLNGFKILKHGE
jgi:signal peptidase I, bacterial type